MCFCLYTSYIILYTFTVQNVLLIKTKEQRVMLLKSSEIHIICDIHIQLPLLTMDIKYYLFYLSKLTIISI